MTGLMQMSAEFYSESAQAPFEGILRVQRLATTDVPGLGSAAYSFTDPYLGPYVVAHDGNLHLRVGWKPVSEGGTIPADMVKRLTEVVRGTMAALRTT